MNTTRDLIINNRKNTCFDPIMLSEEQIETHLQEDNDHIILTDSQVKQVACGRITDLKEYLADPHRIYYECHPISRQVNKEFPIVRISGGQMDFYVPEHDLRKALRNRRGELGEAQQLRSNSYGGRSVAKQRFAQRPPSWNFMTFTEDHKTGQLMSKSALHGVSLVSALHCQAGTERHLSTIITYRVDVSGKVSEGETQVQTKQQEQEQARERRFVLSPWELEYLRYGLDDIVTSETVVRADRDDHAHLTLVVNDTGYAKHTYYLEDGLFHSEYDLPAIMNTDSRHQWFIKGVRHRDNNQPADVVPSEDRQVWWSHGIMYRTIEEGIETLYFPQNYIDKKGDSWELRSTWRLPETPNWRRLAEKIDPNLIFIQQTGPVTIICDETAVYMVGPVSLKETIKSINNKYKQLGYHAPNPVCPFALNSAADGVWELEHDECLNSTSVDTRSVSVRRTLALSAGQQSNR